MPDDSQDDLFALAENDLKILFASGFEMNVDQFDVALPQGPITTELHITVGKGGADPFHWSSVLLGLDASARIRIPAELIDIIAARSRDLHGAKAATGDAGGIDRILPPGGRDLIARRGGLLLCHATGQRNWHRRTVDG